MYATYSKGNQRERQGHGQQKQNLGEVIDLCIDMTHLHRKRQHARKTNRQTLETKPIMSVMYTTKGHNTRSLAPGERSSGVSIEVRSCFDKAHK